MQRRDVLAGGIAMTIAGLPKGAQSDDRSWLMPAEDVRHEATFMQWPVSRRVYEDAVFLEMTQTTIAKIANTIAEFEPVIMLAAQEDHGKARPRLSDRVTLWDVPTEDLWCRDAGPIFLVDGAGNRAVRDIRFNGWGQIQIHKRDGQIARRVARRLGLEMLPSGLKGEAGGVEQDGHGLLIAHESSWVHPDRNPGLTRDEIGLRLLEAYGAERILWSPGVWDLDITDYHIDSLVRFTAPGTLLMNLPDRPDPKDPFHQAALQTHDMLAAEGLSLDVIPEPTRPRIRHPEFVASYANFYVCNGAVIAAQFGDDETDAIAHDALRRHFPDRDIVMLNVDPLGELGGGIHCATKELPAV